MNYKIIIQNNLISLIYYILLATLLSLVFNFKTMSGQIGGLDNFMVIIIILFIIYNIYLIVNTHLKKFKELFIFYLLNNLILPLFFLIFGSNLFEDLFKFRFYNNFIIGLIILIFFILLFSYINYFLNNKK